jgi:hypothetical protein
LTFGKFGIAAINKTSRFADIVARNAAPRVPHDARFAIKLK